MLLVVECSIFSYRCIVKLEKNGINFCDQRKCSENRRFNIRNNLQFECPHICKVLEAIENNSVHPVYVLVHLSNFGCQFCVLRAESYESETLRSKAGCLPLSAKEDIFRYVESVAEFKVMKITDWCYVVK